MLRLAINIILLATVSITPSCKSAQMTVDRGGNENLIIYYEPESGNERLLEAAKKYGSEVLYVYRNINGIAVTVPKGKSVSDALKYYTGIKGVLSVTKDEKMQLD